MRVSSTSNCFNVCFSAHVTAPMSCIMAALKSLRACAVEPSSLSQIERSKSYPSAWSVIPPETSRASLR